MTWKAHVHTHSNPAQIEIHYNLTYTVVSLVFLSPFVGYIIAALINNAIHNKFGQRGVAIIGGLSKILAYTVLCVHPPYPALVVIYGFAGFGIGIEDAAWNAWIGDMQNANEILGLLHACYGLGATLAPLIATSMITKAHLPWWTYYYILVRPLESSRYHSGTADTFPDWCLRLGTGGLHHRLLVLQWRSLQGQHRTLIKRN